ncbi:MAG: hypothetical protein KatS3mg096_575 [Candidatus Parcubacteria bacterium]|nr:MAG: hypothetical protein KatS3mg096_575 [Candidatus Parcubacteria bacterium]
MIERDGNKNILLAKLFFYISLLVFLVASFTYIFYRVRSKSVGNNSNGNNVNNNNTGTGNDTTGRDTCSSQTDTQSAGVINRYVTMFNVINITKRLPRQINYPIEITSPYQKSIEIALLQLILKYRYGKSDIKIDGIFGIQTSEYLRSVTGKGCISQKELASLMSNSNMTSLLSQVTGKEVL